MVPVECLLWYGTIAALRHRNIALMVPGAISAWLRHTPKNGKLLFSMDLAPLEVGYKEAQRGFLTYFWPPLAATWRYGSLTCFSRKSRALV